MSLISSWHSELTIEVMFYCRVIAEKEITITRYFLTALTCYISCSESLQTRKLSPVQWRRVHTQNLSQSDTDSSHGRPGIWPLSIMLHHSKAAKKFWTEQSYFHCHFSWCSSLPKLQQEKDRILERRRKQEVTSAPERNQKKTNSLPECQVVRVEGQHQIHKLMA